MSRRANPTVCQTKKQKGKKRRTTLKYYFQPLPTSYRINVLSLVNDYVVYQERKTKHALKEARQTPGSAESKPHSFFLLNHGLSCCTLQIMTDFTPPKVISNLFYQPLTSFIALPCQAYTINTAMEAENNFRND